MLELICVPAVKLYSGRLCIVGRRQAACHSLCLARAKREIIVVPPGGSIQHACGVESHQTVEESNVLAAVGDCNGNGVATALDVGYDIGLRQSGKRLEIGRLGYWSHKPVAVLEIVYILFGRILSRE